jgi:AcrR family transcriptional regulator
VEPRDLSTRELQRQKTRRRVYECALTVFRQQGVTDCRIEDIAKLAGVSRGAFYFHFPTKADVLLERMRETEVQICAAIEALPASVKLERVLETLIHQLVEIWEQDPTLLPDVCSTALYLTASTMADQQASRLRTVVCGRFQTASARGELSARLAGEMLGDLYLGHMLAGLLAWYGNRAMPLGMMLAGVTELFFSGVRATPKANTKAKAKGKAKAEGKAKGKEGSRKWKR